MKALYDQVSYHTSKLLTRSYSTSFSIGIQFIHHELRNAIFGIYGFVRLADEIVDTFHDFNKKKLLDELTFDVQKAISSEISLNPILNSFQHTVNTYNIDYELIDTFLKSMEMDLDKRSYSKEGYEEYILGSAEVVGLMCLKVFVHGNDEQYKKLKPYAMKLGSAFQKINFLRDLQQDYNELGRVYFPGIDMDEFNETTKKSIEKDIAEDFKMGYKGILMLPKSSRFGVYIAYVYFMALFKKIQGLPHHQLLHSRIRIRNEWKLALLLKSYVRHSVNAL